MQRLSGDVFAVAVLAFWLSTGKYPYGAAQARMQDVDRDFDFDSWADLYNNDDSSPLDSLECPRVREILQRALRR